MGHFKGGGAPPLSPRHVIAAPGCHATMCAEMTVATRHAKPRKAYDLVSPNHDYPARLGDPTRTVLSCTHPRSGGTLLG